MAGLLGNTEVLDLGRRAERGMYARHCSIYWPFISIYHQIIVIYNLYITVLSLLPYISICLLLFNLDMIIVCHLFAQHRLSTNALGEG